MNEVNTMKFELFATLYKEALEYDDVDMFIAERGWQDWMDSYDTDSIGDILTTIYTLANEPIKEMRLNQKLSRAQFCRTYDIKTRTAEDWDSGARPIPDHTKMLVAYTFFMDGL